MSVESGETREAAALRHDGFIENRHFGFSEKRYGEIIENSQNGE